VRSEQLLPFEEHARGVFKTFNLKQVPHARVAVLARAVEAAEWIAREEMVDDTEKLGRFEQTLARSAKKLLRLSDSSLLDEWQEPNWDDFLISEIRHRVVDGARRLGVVPTEIDGPVLRMALTAVSKGELLPEPTPSTAFSKATGTSPIKEKRRAGGPIPNEAIGEITFYLACIYHELTGRVPGYSSTGETPEGTFRDFANQWSGGYSVDEFRTKVIAERNMRDATTRWKTIRVSFAEGDGLDRTPHMRWERAPGKRSLKVPRTED
jgi:hypothetical protein